MARKRKKHNSKEILSFTDVALLLSLTFDLMGYIVFVRSAIGQYECGLMDCFLSFSVLILLVLRITKKD